MADIIPDPSDQVQSPQHAAAEGLSTAEATARFAQYGPNAITEQRTTLLQRLFAYFWGPIPWMIEVAAALSAAVGHWEDFGVIAAMLLINAGVGFFEEKNADDAIQALKQRLAPSARVRRDGKWINLPARDLVPGDLVRIRIGDFVPADARLHEGSIEVDQSALTGESLAVEKGPGDTVPSGSTVTRGEATGLVTATGARTYFGRTVELVQIAKPRLHMEEVISKVVQWLLVMVGTLVGVAVVYTGISGGDLVGILPLAVVLLVSAIPVALPPMFTIS